MRVLRKGAKGEDVKQWQDFLRGEELYLFASDGDFWTKTVKSTKAFQKQNNLTDDGVVGRMTIAKAMSQGFFFGSITDEAESYPLPPDFKPLSSSEREALFGKFKYKRIPTAKNPEKIKITDGWDKKNIVTVDIPELAEATNGKYTRMRLHKDVVYQVLMFFKEVKKKGLLHLILTYAGAFYPRFIRGSKENLSSHSWGTSFDINVAWNGLGKVPALKGQKGSVRQLVKIANKWGLFWGGHFRRKDGMHLEVAFVIPDPKNKEDDDSE